MSFNKDALIHKLQDENDKLRIERTAYKLDKEAYKGTIDSLRQKLDELEKEKGMDALIKDALYQFVKFYKEDEFDQLDMMLIVDRFLEDEYDKGKR